MASVPVAAFIPNYIGQNLGVSLAAMGLVLLLSRSFDAITDPLIAWNYPITEKCHKEIKEQIKKFREGKHMSVKIRLS